MTSEEQDIGEINQLARRSRIRTFERAEDGRWWPTCMWCWDDPIGEFTTRYEDPDESLLSLLPHVRRRHPEWIEHSPQST